jgi:hypothetical protein
MLTYADVCWRMQRHSTPTQLLASKRMLTYADVC